MERTNEKKFSLHLDKASNVLNAMAKGAFAPEDANAFVTEYQQMISQIDAKTYELHFDCTQLKVSSPDMVPMLSACFEMYKNDGFKKTIFDCGTSATLKMQARRVANMVGLPNYEII